MALALAPASLASTITYGTPSGSVTETDTNPTPTDFPANATATFAFSTNTVTITLTNLESDTFFDSQNLSGIAFSLGGTTSVGNSTAASNGTANVINPGGTGSTASAHPITENTTPTVGNNELSTTSPDWNLLQVGGSGSFNGVAVATNTYIAGISAAGPGWKGINSIVGLGPFDGVNPLGSGGCPNSDCNSGNPIVSPTSPDVGSGYHQATQQMIYGSVTFTLDITGVTSSTTINGPVSFIFGPDGPDADDFITGQVVTPEPSAFYLCGIGLATILLIRFWRLRHRLVMPGLQQMPVGVLEAVTDPACGQAPSVATKLSRRISQRRRKTTNSC